MPTHYFLFESLVNIYGPLPKRNWILKAVMYASESVVLAPLSTEPMVEELNERLHYHCEPIASSKHPHHPIDNPCDFQEQQYLSKKERVKRFVEHLVSIQAALVAELANYQSYASSQDEFHRIFECLGTLDEIRSYLGHRAKIVAVFFPLNLPLYALCLYGLIPALVADQVYIRTPQRMASLVRKLLPLLKLERFFPNISIAFMGREEFVQSYVTGADVTIFTGKLGNAQHVMAQTKHDSLFLFNGWGCNPIVLGSDADIEFAATKTIDARLFCSGQDCAAPDTILVHKNQVSQFVQNLKRHLVNVKVGDYHDSQVRVGKLADHGQIQLISSLLLKFNDYIVYGGCIDYHKAIIHPTIIVAPLSRVTNYEELFSPVFFINTYDDDDQLAKYFNQPRYIENEMYISLFGSSPYVKTLRRSIIIHNQVVFDTDRGNDAFGGFSMGASFVCSHRNIVPKPILVPRDIFDFLEQRGARQQLTSSTQKKIAKRVCQTMKEIFNDNLVFGFLFGSIALGNATRSSDINTMVVIRQTIPAQVKRYISWVENYQRQIKLVAKVDRPSVIFSHQELEEAIANVISTTIDSSFMHHPMSERVIWIDALLGTQRGVAGDKALALQYRHKLRPFFKNFKTEMVLTG